MHNNCPSPEVPGTTEWNNVIYKHHTNRNRLASTLLWWLLLNVSLIAKICFIVEFDQTKQDSSGKQKGSSKTGFKSNRRITFPKKMIKSSNLHHCQLQSSGRTRLNSMDNQCLRSRTRRSLY